ncbi:NUDIX hydrolase [Aestuariibius sp. 2305UL40-4]|uniref:NUDIX hydrolase n=1 Tax=Aestuariibius violaceus TaxID=3234132 RepID=UPI00345EC68F
MTMMRPLTKARRLSLAGVSKRSVRTQFAALCFREKKGELQVCLVTSRTSKRWILPKGWPIHGHTPARAAAIEAYEEAGLRGRTYETCLGVYETRKRHDQRRLFLAMVYPLKVKKELNNWPEKHERRRKWFTPEKAADKVDEPGLADMLRGFDPASLPR